MILRSRLIDFWDRARTGYAFLPAVITAAAAVVAVAMLYLDARLVLCYTGEPRNSGTNNWEITKKHIDGDRHVFDCFERIRDTAMAMRAALAAGDWDGVGRAVADEWENRKRLAPGVSTPVIDELVARAKQAGAIGAKVCGAGGGGCLFCFGPPDRREAIRAALTQAGARLLHITNDRHGLIRG